MAQPRKAGAVALAGRFPALMPVEPCRLFRIKRQLTGTLGGFPHDKQVASLVGKYERDPVTYLGTQVGTYSPVLQLTQSDAS